MWSTSKKKKKTSENEIDRGKSMVSGREGGTAKKQKKGNSDTLKYGWCSALCRMLRRAVQWSRPKLLDLRAQVLMFNVDFAFVQPSASEKRIAQKNPKVSVSCSREGG